MDSHVPFSILLVEDEAVACEIIASMLEMKYPQALIYRQMDGKAGLDAFGLHLPDIIITDINMPEMDGLQMLELMHTIKPEAYVIVVTAHSDSGYLEKIKANGLVSVLVSKPINFEALFEAIDKGVATLPNK